MEFYDDYPITLTEEELRNNTGINLASKLKGDDEKIKINNFLNSVHSAVYDYLIYTTGDRLMKDRIINKYKEQLEKPIKRALLCQARYLISNQTNIAMWNGVVKTVNGIDVKSVSEILTRIIAPEVYNLLGATVPNILYSGGYNV